MCGQGRRRRDPLESELPEPETSVPVASSVNPSRERPPVTAAIADRRGPQPRSTAMMARSRSPLVVVMSGAFGSRLGLLERALPGAPQSTSRSSVAGCLAASSGDSNPLSVASTASLRMANIRTMIDDDPGPRSSRDRRPSKDANEGQTQRDSEVIPGCRTGYNSNRGYDPRRTSDHETEGIWNRYGVSRRGIDRPCGFRTAGGGSCEARKLPSGRI